MNYYKDFSINKLNTPKFRHVLLLLYWPLYGILFLLLERMIPLDFREIYSKLDDFIPFCEYFVIPYYYWFVFLIGMLIYTFFFDVEAFRRYMWFIIITYSVAIFTYTVYPSMQMLRPTEFERNNIFTQIVTYLYKFDTNTNVCPSLHVVGSMGVMFAGFDCNRTKKSIKVNLYFVISAVLISVSTVFLKQHSIIDIFWGVVLSIAGYLAVYKTKHFGYGKEMAKETVAKETVKNKETITV